MIPLDLYLERFDALSAALVHSPSRASELTLESEALVFSALRNSVLDDAALASILAALSPSALSVCTLYAVCAHPAFSFTALSALGHLLAGFHFDPHSEPEFLDALAGANRLAACAFLVAWHWSHRPKDFAAFQAAVIALAASGPETFDSARILLTDFPHSSDNRAVVGLLAAAASL